MDDEALMSRVLHLRQVEKLSQEQIAQALGIGRKKVRRMLKGKDCANPIERKSMLGKYANLIGEWYKQYPKLKAIQVYERPNNSGKGFSGLRSTNRVHHSASKLFQVFAKALGPRSRSQTGNR